MLRLPFTQVDAFAGRPFQGNPAAIVRLEAWLDDATLLAIAAENNLSETAFTVPATGDADFELRWFTPVAEVALCGHATLASGHVLMTGAAVRFRTRKAGILTVSRDGDALMLDLPATRVAEASDPALLALLGTPDAALFLSCAGANDTAVVLLPDEAAVHACAPDMRALAAVNLLVIVTAPGDGEYDVVSRVFAPAWGIDEDPVTGSAHAALTPFWCDRLGRDRFMAFQASRRGGMLDCRLEASERAEEERVLLRAGCVTVIEGSFLLPD